MKVQYLMTFCTVLRIAFITKFYKKISNITNSQNIYTCQ